MKQLALLFTALIIVPYASCNQSGNGGDKFAATGTFSFRPESIGNTKWESCHGGPTVGHDEKSTVPYFYKEWIGMTVKSGKLASAHYSRLTGGFEDKKCTSAITDIASSIKRKLSQIGTKDQDIIDKLIAETTSFLNKPEEGEFDLSRFKPNADFSKITHDFSDHPDDPGIQTYTLQDGGKVMIAKTVYTKNGGESTGTWYRVSP